MLFAHLKRILRLGRLRLRGPGWKAQNKSITMFGGEAYNVEMGITNELFPTATEEDPGCQGHDKPEVNDVTRTEKNDNGPPANQSFNNPVHILADWMQFSLLMRFMDAPQPDPNPSASAIRGKTVFSNIAARSAIRRRCRPLRS